MDKSINGGIYRVDFAAYDICNKNQKEHIMFLCGGKKEGAVRLMDEPSTAIRMAVSQIKSVKQFISKTHQLPAFSSKVQAGFPSPADDYIESYLDLNTKFIHNPSATFVLQATGESMIDVGIFPGTWLIVDKSLEATDGKIVIAAINGELTVKRFSCRGGIVQLLPANPKYAPINVTEEQDMVIWGVVTCVIQEMR